MTQYGLIAKTEHNRLRLQCETPVEHGAIMGVHNVVHDIVFLRPKNCSSREDETLRWTITPLVLPRGPTRA